ncbi:MAG: leucine-rich repeat protein, partial [Clostridia bacterium]|nr:leucine-rich repeat protein [Clostridia bacterium]
MSTSSSVVSQGYAPPEQYNLSSLDGRIDQYALAATLYFVLTGIRPADVLQRMAQPGSLPSIRSKNPVVTPVVENVIMKGMSLRVQDRYPVVEDFWSALQKAATQTRNTHFTWKKGIALALSVTLAAGALAYFVPKWTSAPTLAPEVTEAPLPTPQQAMLPANDPSAPPTDEPAVTTAPEEMPAPFAAGDYLCQQLPDGTLAITGYQGSESQLTIPDTLDGLPVTQIAASAFENNQTIQSVTLPEGLTQLSFAAFQNCASLTDITFPSTLTTIEDQAFEGCVRLQSAHLPEGITHVGSRTFRNCTALTDVELRDSQGSIRAQTFDGCTSLEILTIPGYINEIHPTAFDNCPNLCLLVHMSTCGEFFARENRIPHSYNQEDYATEDCFVYSVQNNDTIRIDKYIGECDFVLIPHQLEGKDIGAIAEGAFSNNEQLIYVNIPETINELKSGCFSHCTALETVHLPLNGSVDIQSNVFDGCTSLRNITLTDAVDKISSAAFRNCTSLQSISIPEGITNLYDNTFAGCTNLEMVAIPASMRLIMNSAFSGCDKLNLVVYPGTYGETYAQQQNIPYTYAEGPVPASEPEPEPVFGSINILYVDTADNAVLLEETISDLPVGDYSYTPDRAGEIEGYELVSSDPQYASILEDGSASNDIVFMMQKIPVYGSINILYVDTADNA